VHLVIHLHAIECGEVSGRFGLCVHRQVDENCENSQGKKPRLIRSAFTRTASEREQRLTRKR
jgi:hypothetical protein